MAFVTTRYASLRGDDVLDDVLLTEEQDVVCRQDGGELARSGMVRGDRAAVTGTARLS